MAFLTILFRDVGQDAHKLYFRYDKIIQLQLRKIIIDEYNHMEYIVPKFVLFRDRKSCKLKRAGRNIFARFPIKSPDKFRRRLSIVLDKTPPPDRPQGRVEVHEMTIPRLIHRANAR